ncbi:MAG: type 11 methyltransferase [Halothiobacillaceae bacterium]|nr:MAG: type 11 methyltransferase [Halothiobacillaceae bacterium]
MSVKSRRKNALKRAEINQIRQDLRHWYSRYLGQILHASEREQLEPVFNTLFGYHALQVGCLLGNDLLANSRIPHRVVMDPDKNEDHTASIYAYPDALPISSDAVDMVLLPHTLEFERDPHEILREVDRVLIPEGHVIILGFNPWSLWGLFALWAKCWKKSGPPWCGRFLSLNRIKDWLALLGFEIIVVKQSFYRPPIQQKSITKRLQFMERLGQRYWPGLGGVYLLVARKKVTTLTPIKPRWRPRRALVGKWAESSTQCITPPRIKPHQSRSLQR